MPTAGLGRDHTRDRIERVLDFVFPNTWLELVALLLWRVSNRARAQSAYFPGVKRLVVAHDAIVCVGAYIRSGKMKRTKNER